jgi:hypothetical protein
MTSPDTGRPETIPARIAETLEASSDGQLREIIHYAQRLLREHPPLTDALESREGEELVRMDDHGAYTHVVVERPEETGQARGPFAYMVTWEPTTDEEGQYKWHYLGRVYRDAGGDRND